ncbi:hypothetical protein L211DRAFT_43610 [Terfezia boudieri ATCC MYA-4762]|uniref:Uncharacterized protein n=1 Tax=Terfezia boudieri ATCC MYA-4762 TaxID=1051890 RepID=A0A3N4M3R7_9PEZI|nr:hypothetical protein L211DRAFT_43610 [Terfezia boudieri ATCC MYA-4762]
MGFLLYVVLGSLLTCPILFLWCLVYQQSMHFFLSAIVFIAPYSSLPYLVCNRQFRNLGVWNWESCHGFQVLWLFLVSRIASGHCFARGVFPVTV